MDIKEYLNNVLELEKMIYTLTQTINRLEVRESRINVSPTNYSEPKRPDNPTGFLNFILDFLIGIFYFVMSAIVVGIPVCFADIIIMYFFFNGSNWGRMKIIVITCGCIGFFLSMWLASSGNKEEQSKYEKKMDEYKKSIKHDKQRVARALQQKQNIQLQKKFLINKKKSIQGTLDRLYALNVVYPKYRDFVSIAMFYEYFDSGRCNSLVGHEGAYNIYESEIRMNAILYKLDDIIYYLEEIKNIQYAIYTAVNESNGIARGLYDNSVKLIDSADAISQNTAISAYASVISAKNTEVMKYISVFDRL